MLRAIGSALSAGCLFSVLVTAAQAEIGTVAAVNNDMRGQPPAAGERDLLIKDRVVQDERIATSSDGSGQLIFLDQTTLAVAPNSEITLDSYVYDPAQQSGEIALSMGRGALRFIGGRITKRTEAVVRTPTATIGIRGGMAMIRVDPTGQTQVIQLAGEYTRVTGVTGRAVTLSRPNAMASADGAEGAQFAGIADADTLDQAFGAFESSGGSNSDAGSAPRTQAEAGVQQVANHNSEVTGGENRPAISTSGEKDPAPPPGQPDQPGEGPGTLGTEVAPATEEKTLDGTEVAGGADTTGGTVPPPVTVPPPANFPVAGGVFTQTGGHVGFDSVSPGSIVGETAAGEFMKLPAPFTPEDFVTTFTDGPLPSFFAGALGTNVGFFEFGFADEASVSGMGAVAGHGFADLDHGFYMTTFGTDPANGPPSFGIAVFGNPTPGQGSVAAIDDGTIPATANTVDVYVIEPTLTDLGGAEVPLAPDGPEGELFLIANGGGARFPHPSHGREASGGRLMTAEVGFDFDPFTNGQASFLSVFVSPLASAGSGPRTVGQIVGTDSTGQSIFVEHANVGLFEDAAGNTMFGPDGNYLVATSLHRPGGTGPLIFDPGVEHDIGQPDVVAEPILNLLTRAPSGGFSIADPLPLASEPIGRASTGLPGGVFDGVVATGFARCSSGNCGDQQAPGQFAGLYALQPGFGLDSGVIEFDFGQFNAVDTNEVGVIFDLSDGGFGSGIQGGFGSPGTPNFLFIAPAGTIGSSGYLDDQHFALTHTGTQTIAGLPMSGEIVIASSGLAGGEEILPAGVATQPQFLRWGWWSASYRPIDGATGTLREDIVHMGTWIAGARPDPTLVPFAGTASYAGLAVGTDADLAAGITRTVGGQFALTYDFGTSSGSLDLTLPGAGFAGIPVSGVAASAHDYTAFGSNPAGLGLVANGGFFTGNGDPVRATGGHFNIVDTTGARQIVGVFGGDRQ